MVKYICEACEEEIKEGYIMILELKNRFAYLHLQTGEKTAKAYSDEALTKGRCLSKYMKKGHDSIRGEVHLYSDLKEQAKGAH